MTRRVLVTGANRGFGAACVTAFSLAGWDVVAVSRTATSHGAGSVDRVQWDVTDDDTSPLLEALHQRPLDLLVNNAGVGTPGALLAGVDVARLLDVVDVNVGGAIHATRAVLPNLLTAPTPLVLNVTSRLGSIQDQAAGRYRGYDTSYAYRISKAAQNMATVCLANELAPRVRVWAVHPGSLRTGMGRAGADGDPLDAARRLVELATEQDVDSPRLVDLDGGEISW
ncbi:MAG: SDR family NAD(P)-dependent oxidoreductase [Ilumatobacteraceae bacterium]